MNDIPDYIVNPNIEEYIRNLAPTEDEVLKEMEKLGEERDFPIIGPLVGRFIYQIALISGAKNVFELGSGFGYSTYWFAKAVGDDGLVIYTEFSEENANLAQDFFIRGGVEKRVRMKIGDAIEILDQTSGEFDIIFNDIDKEDYPLTIDKAYRKLKKGGLFITDNTLWYGRVLTDDESESTKGVKEFTRLLFEDKGFLTTIIPIRDGISLSIKL